MSSDEDDFSDSMNDLFDEEDDEDSDTSSEETSEQTDYIESYQEMPRENQVLQIKAILTMYNKEVLQEVVYCGYNEDTTYLLKQGRQPIMPVGFYKKDMTLQEMLEVFNHALGNGEVLYHWKNSIPDSELIYVEYKKMNGYGCQHYASNCMLYCTMCKKYCGCTYCHHGQLDASEVEHEIACADVIKCRICNNEQDYHNNICDGCKQPLYKNICVKCGFVSSVTDFFHCAQCNRCYEGQQSVFFHCEKCKQCVKNIDREYHEKNTCGTAKRVHTDTCPICLGGFDYMLMKSVPLSCKHDIHQSCLQKQIQQNKRQCPMCQQVVKTHAENAIEYQKFISVYAMTEVPQHKLDTYCQIQCQNCQREFVKHWHPMGYICPYCDSIHCTQGAEYDNDEDGKRLVEEQYRYIREERHQIPIYPLILWPKDKYEEMLPMLTDYVERYKDYWIACRAKMVDCPYEMPLHEMVNAFCLVRDIDEYWGFAALNICHARKFFPPPDPTTGCPTGLDKRVGETMAEVREVKRLNLV